MARCCSCAFERAAPQAVAASRSITSAESWGAPWSIKNLVFYDKPVPPTNQRSLGYEKVWVYCSNPNCRHSAALDVNHMSDEVTFNELMPRMLCTICDHQGANVCTAWHVPGRSDGPGESRRESSAPTRPIV